MSILTPPSILPNPGEISWRSISNTQAMPSSLSNATQTLELPGIQWADDPAFSNLPEEYWRLWEAFKSQLRGRSGRFYWGPAHAQYPRGVATGTPLVNGASQTGQSLVTDGWTHSVTGILKVGDYFHYDTPTGWRCLHHIVSADVNSDGSGNATLTIEPPIRESPADDAAIVTTKPTCVMMLTGDDMPVGVQPPVIASFQLHMREAFS